MPTGADSQSQKIVVHPGFMKTGSTYLQRKVFPNLSGCDYHSFGTGSNFIPLIRNFRNGSAREPDRLISSLRHLLGEEPLQMFSFEGLVGNFRANFADFELLTETIGTAFPDANILLMIRRQADLIESLYKQAIQGGHIIGINDFVNYRNGRFHPFREGDEVNVDISRFDFEYFVTFYEKVFSPARVHVVPFESLASDPVQFNSSLGSILGREIEPQVEGDRANVSFNSTTIAIARRLNRLYRGPHNRGGIVPYRPFESWLKNNQKRTFKRRTISAINSLLDPRTILQGRFGHIIPGEKAIMNPIIAEKIRLHHQESNRRLDERLGLGLSELGYY